MSDRILYQWQDGSHVELLLGESGSEEAIFLYVDNLTEVALLLAAKMTPSGPRVSVDGTSLAEKIRQSGLSMKSTMSAYPLVKRRLLGFLIDARASTFRDGHLLACRTEIDLRVPEFVTDEQWEQRYQIARDVHVIGDFASRKMPRYLNRVRGLELCHLFLHGVRPGGDPVWRVRWSDRSTPNAALPGCGVSIALQVRSVEEAVDLVTEKNLVLPESKRGEWDEENVEHGVFVLPTPEEVEIFRILDEPLPFFLPPEQAEGWLMSRSS